MNDPLPTPEFDRTKYDRPNDPWVCGRACEGKPCHLGPTPSGECRSVAECRPLLETRPGESKGRWRCTRSKEAGGPCETGPGPQGECARPVIPCAPRRSLRSLRGRCTWATIALTVGALALLCAGPWRWAFLSPGIVSLPHRSAGFNTTAGARFGAGGCAGCHEAAEGGIGQWLQTAFNTQPAPLDWRAMARATPDRHTRMDDRNCLSCHVQHARHQPNVIAAHSCSDCHREHSGPRIPPPSDDTCASCHNHPDRLAKFTRSSVGDPRDFHPPLPDNVRSFQAPLPPARTNLFAHYWDGHPDFRLHAAGMRDGNTLRFNHEIHLGASVKIFDAPAGESRGLGCVDCHQPDPTGAYLARLDFKQHCQACHSLQFDPVNPDLKLPHGEPGAIAATVSSLAALQVQYADLARRRGESDRTRIDEFARSSAARLRQLVGSGEQLVDLILFTGDPRLRMFQEDQAAPGKRAHYAGCAYCHEVTRDTRNQPVITPPWTPDRWLPGGRFTHARHTQLTCQECHSSALRSRQTSDINLPHQTPTDRASPPGMGEKTCMDCHRPGGAPANCATCHTYHTRISR